MSTLALQELRTTEYLTPDVEPLINNKLEPAFVRGSCNAATRCNGSRKTNDVSFARLPITSYSVQPPFHSLTADSFSFLPHQLHVSFFDYLSRSIIVFQEPPTSESYDLPHFRSSRSNPVQKFTQSLWMTWILRWATRSTCQWRSPSFQTFCPPTINRFAISSVPNCASKPASDSTVPRRRAKSRSLSTDTRTMHTPKVACPTRSTYAASTH